MPQLAVRALSAAPHWVDEAAAWLHAEWFAASGEGLGQVRARLLADGDTSLLPLSDAACLTDPDGAEGPLVGLYTLEEMVNPLTGLNLLCLSNLFVAPSWRRRGIGRQLCNAAFERARSLGVPRLSLFTDSHMRFYESQGWRGINVATRHSRGAEALAVLMQRDLQPLRAAR